MIMGYLPKNDISLRLIATARRTWENGSDFRAKRNRYKRFTYGDQWSDIVTSGDGTSTTARMDALRHGKEPMTNNLIRRMVKCVIGRFRMWLDENRSKDAGYMQLREQFSLDELDCRTLEEFLISGVAVQRVAYDFRHGKKGLRIDNVSPVRFFVNNFCDPRGDDIEMIGMLHDMSMAEVVMKFAQGSRRRAAAIRDIYGALDSRNAGGLFGLSNTDGEEFGYCSEPGRCRVVEVWTLESRESVRWHDLATGRCGEERPCNTSWIDRENRSRAENGTALIDNVLTHSTAWHCRWLSPDGSVLDEYDSPYSHRSHPFAVKKYPMTDGEVHSLVEDVIDQQIYINRLITLMEKVMSTSAKGVLLFPKAQKSEDMDWTTLSSLWSSPDAIIPYEGIDGYPEPKQLITQAGDYGARELLSMQLQMIEDVSGVSNALLGRSSGGNVGYERYESEVRNATVAINDMLLSFVHFCKERDKRLFKIIGN